MSSLDCEDPTHEKCEECDGCVTCGCLCHLAGEPSPVFMHMGLKGFQEETQCPKCRASSGYTTMFHEMPIVRMGGAEYPCAEWMRRGLLQEHFTEHLCVRCLRCGYGYPMKTADS